MKTANRETLRRFYILSSLGILLILAMAISTLFVSSYRTITEKHYEELRAEVLRSKREFISSAVEQAIQIIDLERARCPDAPEKGCEEEVKARVHDYIRALRFKDDGYVWVNAVRDYSGGEGYAYRFVHPNLPETEGMALSTSMRDIKGNFPYLTELEGVKKDGEIYFDYWFKKMGSDEIGHKLTFAKLYRPYDWIVATGVYLDDVDDLVNSRMRSWDEDSRRIVLWAVIITGFASLFAWFSSLLVGRRVESIYSFLLNEVDTREKALQQFNQALERKVESRTREIAASEKKYLDLYENAPDMYLSVDASTGLVEHCNQTLCEALGRAREGLVGRPVEEIYHPDCLEEVRRNLISFSTTGEIRDQELFLRTGDGSKLAVSLSVSAVRDETGAIRSGRSTLRDITERKYNNSINAARLLLMQFAATHTLDELLEEALNQAENLTDSRISFYHLVDDELRNLRLQAWSTRTKAEFCRSAGIDTHYPIAKAGVWVDCVHAGKPVIHNDYASLPHRKGMPEGHPEVTRELVAPVFRGGKIKAILGVGNKPSEYRDKDVEAILLLIDLVWEIVERKEVDEESKRLYAELEQRVAARTAELKLKNSELERLNKAFVGRELRMVELKKRIGELEKRLERSKGSPGGGNGESG